MCFSNLACCFLIAFVLLIDLNPSSASLKNKKKKHFYCVALQNFLQARIITACDYYIASHVKRNSLLCTITEKCIVRFQEFYCRLPHLAANCMSTQQHHAYAIPSAILTCVKDVMNTSLLQKKPIAAGGCRQKAFKCTCAIIKLHNVHSDSGFLDMLC